MAKTKEPEPSDRGYVVGIIFFILGLGTLLPWNFFMTASMYFNKRLNSPVRTNDTSVSSKENHFNNMLNSSEWTNGTSVGSKEYYFNNWMTLLSQLPLLLFTLLNSILYPRISEKVRIAGSLVFILLLFILTAALVMIDIKEDPFFSITMATIWFINSFGAVLQGSLFGLVGLLPVRYSAVFMSGQGLAGTFAAIAMLIAIASEAGDQAIALGYFITPCVGTLVTLMSYLLLPKLEFARFYLNKSKMQRYELDTVNQLLPKDCSQDKEEMNGLASSVANGNPSSLDSSTGSRQPFISVEDAVVKETKSSVLEVFKKIWLMAFCVTFVFTVTLSVFPAVTLDVKSIVKSGKWVKYFTPVCCFLVFNVMDWLGRTVTSVVQWPPKESRLFPVLVISRVVFVPLLMLCNVNKKHFFPVWFSHDAIFVVIMMFFSVSSGYFVCLSMSYAPQLVAPSDGETAGALMTFFLALGLSLGAGLSFLLRIIV